MPLPQTYTVIVYPPPPTERDRSAHQASTVTVATPTRVVQVKGVRDPEEAARGADVQPGGYCVVVVNGRRFDRARQAPLEERELDGNPIIEAVSA